jgi:signal peptidase I
VIGLPGDRIIYRNKSLYIKEACKPSDAKCPDFVQIINTFTNKYQGPVAEKGLNQFETTMLSKTHNILTDQYSMPRTSRYFKQAGTAPDEFLVPAGHYFVMGDNRDNSLDGRFWGFVPEENLVGQAVAIWMSFDFDRDENSFLPTWIPTNIRFERIGAIN